MKILIPALLLLSFFIVIQYFRTQHYIAVGVGLAEKAVPFSRINPEAKTRILIIGDSTVVGTGAEDPEHSVAGYLGADYPEAEIVNKGVNGTRTHELIERFESIQDQHFDLVLIHTGGNDIVHFTPQKSIREDLPKVLDLANQIGDKVVLLSCGDVGTGRLFPWGTRWIYSIRTRQIRQIFLQVAAEKGVHYVDLLRKHKDDPFALDYKKHYAPDLFHPSGAGYRDWYEHIKAVLKEIN